jgi:hypothetical protein
MRLGKAAKLARKVRGVARVSAVVPKATRSALDTMATAEAQPSAYKDQLMTNALHELELGILIGGCHEHLLHGNLATTDGGRVVLAWYMPQALRNRIGRE